MKNPRHNQCETQRFSKELNCLTLSIRFCLSYLTMRVVDQSQIMLLLLQTPVSLSGTWGGVGCLCEKQPEMYSHLGAKGVLLGLQAEYPQVLMAPLVASLALS